MKVSEAFEPFLHYSEVERHTAATTRQKYQDVFRTWILPWLGDSELGRINRLQILEMRKAMVDKGLSISRQYSVIMCLKSFLKFCGEILDTTCIGFYGLDFEPE